MIDSKGRDWTSNADRSEWTDGERMLIVNPAMTDEQVLNCIEDIFHAPPPKTEVDRIAELEAQLAALIAKLS